MKNLLTRLSVKKFRQLLLSGELSCRGLVEYYLRRIEAYDHAGPCLNALSCSIHGRWRKRMQ